MKSHDAAPILITVDLEDWFQVENLRSCFPLWEWQTAASRLEVNTRLILDLFDRYRVQATFFVLGWNAERCPGLIREIQRRGHEIASHGYSHEMCCSLPKGSLWDDLRKSKEILESITGQPVSGYRAPNFSITPALIDGLGALGYRYDSSYNPLKLSKAHKALSSSWRKSDCGYCTAENGVIELPISNLQFGSLRIPWGGGGFFRLWPTALFEWGVHRILKEEERYVFYIHPWEFDPDQPPVTGVPWLRKTRHYLNLSQVLHRLTHFLTAFEERAFVTCLSYLSGNGNQPAS